MDRQRIILFFSVFVFSFLAFGCSSSVKENGPSYRQNTFVVHAPNEIQGMNPVITVGVTARIIQNLVFDRLIALDYETLDLRPVTCDGLPEVTDDHHSYIFTLNPKAKFSDGSSITAEDIVFSFKAIMNPFSDSAPLRAEMHNFKDCVALEDGRVKFTMEEASPLALNKLAIYFWILPKHVYDPKGITDGYSSLEATSAGADRSSVDNLPLEKMKAFSLYFSHEQFQREKGTVIGSGRYLFDEWMPGQTIRLVKNPDYWNQASVHPFDQQNMDTIVFKIILDRETMLTALKAGEIDFSDDFKPSQYVKQMEDPDFTGQFDKKSLQFPYFYYIGWNANIKDQPEKIFFSDPDVRTAMSHLVDVDQIIESVTYGTGSRITSMVYGQRPEHNNNLTPIPYDPEKAKQLLADAGWADSDGDGVLDNMVNNKKVDFRFTMYYDQGNSVRQQIALIIQKSFQKAGIEMDFQELDWGTYLERLKNHELEAWIGGWAYDSDEQDLFSLFHSSQAADGYNWGNYFNQEADQLMHDITVEWDQEKRFEMHRQIQAILYAEQPYTLLYQNSALVAYNKRWNNDNWYGQRPCYDLPQFSLVNEK